VPRRGVDACRHPSYLEGMALWLCPWCKRNFGRANQSHKCRPALTIDAYLAAQPAALHATYKAVLRQLAKLGPIDIDPVPVGIMVKRNRTFCELRPRRDAVELSFKLSEPLAHARIRKTIHSSTHRQAHFVDLRSPRDVDAQIIAWLTKSYSASPT
jgi:Domain of unknown function (DUF5655)